MTTTMKPHTVAYPRTYKGVGINGFITPKLPKSDLATDAEYVAKLVNVIAEV